MPHPNILFIGMFNEIKGVDLLIKAIPLIKEAIPNVKLFLAGAGPLEKQLKKLVADLKLEENIKFVGFVTGDVKYTYLESADICVLPSVYEHFGISILEAMSFGIPVVASNVGGIPYLVENMQTGLLFEPKNVQDLSDKVKFLLLDEKLRKTMGLKAKEKSKEYTWDKIAAKTIELYEKVGK